MCDALLLYCTSVPLFHVVLDLGYISINIQRFQFSWKFKLRCTLRHFSIDFWNPLESARLFSIGLEFQTLNFSFLQLRKTILKMQIGGIFVTPLFLRFYCLFIFSLV